MTRGEAGLGDDLGDDIFGDGATILMLVCSRSLCSLRSISLTLAAMDSSIFLVCASMASSYPGCEPATLISPGLFLGEDDGFRGVNGLGTPCCLAAFC